MTHGLLSQSLYAPQLSRAAAAAAAAGLDRPRTVAVSQRALFDDGPATLAAVLAAIGETSAGPARAALRSYESLSGGREAMAARPGDAYAGHRTKLAAGTVAALDALYRRPNCALADALSDAAVVPAAVGFAADGWLRVSCGAPDL